MLFLFLLLLWKLESDSFYQIMRVKASIKADTPKNTSKLIAVYKNVTELCGLN